MERAWPRTSDVRDYGVGHRAEKSVESVQDVRMCVSFESQMDICLTAGH